MAKMNPNCFCLCYAAALLSDLQANCYTYIMYNQDYRVKKSLTKPVVCVHFFQRGQLWAGCTNSGQLILCHTDQRHPKPQRISLPEVSGVTCMIQVKNQVCLQKGRQGKFLFLTVVFFFLTSSPFSYGWAAMAGAVGQVRATVR